MRLLTLCLLLITAFGVSAQDKAGVAFQEKSFDALLADAKAQDKLIFIDAYTTWCGPCKMMTANIFPQEKVGTLYNARFVNAKFDMEKGEGIELAKRYNVNAYPTYLFVNGDGELVHKGLGSIPADDLLILADVAGSDQNLLSLSNRYDNGDRDPDFVSSYAKLLTSVNERTKASEVINVYLNSLDRKEWSDESVMAMIISTPGEIGGERFNFILENAGAFIKQTSSAQVIGKLQNILMADFAAKQSERKMPELAEMTTYYKENAAPLADRLAAHFKMFRAQRTAPEEYPMAAVEYFNRYPSNSSGELNSIAWGFYENVDDASMLKTALGWAMESVRLDKQYMNMDTLAWLYSKMGMKEQAKKTAAEAIELAKAEGSDYSETLPLLED